MKSYDQPIKNRAMLKSQHLNENLLHQRAKSTLMLFLRTSSIHGLNHFVAAGRHICEISMWVFVVGLSVYGTLYLSMITWMRYQSSPTVLSIERDMLAWNTTFPGITICPDAKLDPEELANYISQYNTTDEDKRYLEAFIKALANATYKNFDKVPKYKGIAPEEYQDLLMKLTYKFNPTVTIGTSGGILTIVPTMTEMGPCYAINSEVAIYNSPEYIKNNRWDLVKSNNSTLTIHPFDREVYAQAINIHVSFKAYIHSPLDVPDISTRYERVPINTYLRLSVAAKSVYTTPEAARLSVSQRRCRYIHENPLLHNSVYTYTLCRMECRVRLSLRYCHCIPHFYRRIGNEKICDVEGMHCLAKHSYILINLREKGGKKVDCKCFPTCVDVSYTMETLAQEWILERSSMQWGITTYPKMRYRRDIIFGFTDVLVSVGGMAGLFLGCSVLSFIEIFYFITLRLFCFVRDKY